VYGLLASRGSVDLQPAFLRYTIATTTTLIFGSPSGGERDEWENTFAYNFRCASSTCAKRLRLAGFHWAYKPKEFTTWCDIVQRSASFHIEEALRDRQKNGEKADSGRHAFILDLYKELQDRALVRDQLVNVLTAGRDTTACLMSWAL
jgi:hypothetical protein